MPPATPPREPLDVVLHIGTGKTGTSSIQRLLHRNRERLAELGCLYPQTPGRTRHTRLGLFIRPDDALDDFASWRRERHSSPQAFRRTFRRQLFGEIDASGASQVLFSDEALYGSPDAALRRLRRFTDRIARTVRVVVYLRRQDDHMVSRYQQVVKVGETRRLAERLQLLDLSQTYDYRARLRTWQQLLEPATLVVRRFEPDAFVGQSLYEDFLGAVGIRVRVGDLEPVDALNTSLDAESVELLRILNVFRVEDAGADSMLPPNRSLVDRLLEASSGPTLTLPDRVLDQFMAQWEQSNRAVARDFLGEDGGELFRTPRKSRNTTTSQHLDPARLDHFLALLELPEPTHAPLRALTEREAKDC